MSAITRGYADWSCCILPTLELLGSRLGGACQHQYPPIASSRPPTFPRGHCHCNWPLGLMCGHLWCCWWNNDKAAAWLQGCHKWNKSTKQWPRVKFRWCQLKTSGCHLANQDPCASYMITVRTVQKHHQSIRLHVHTFFQRGIPRIGSLMI